MARLNSNLFLGITGAIGKQLVFKKYGDKTVVTSYPDMSKVKPSELQEVKRKGFADAVAYAKNISRNPEKKAEYLKKVKAGESVYQFALKEYLAMNKK